MLRNILLIATITTVSLTLYLWIALPLLQQADRDQTPATGSAAKVRPIVADSSIQDQVSTREQSAVVTQQRSSSATRLIEIHGQISDTQGQPIDAALITEERYFFAANSNANGQYRILLELPPHRSATLQFLRAGFTARRVQLSRTQLQQEPVIRLDMVLDESDHTLSLPGRVSNDFGAGLADVRIEISAIGAADEHNYYLTVFSDERGNFVLEGVVAATHYRLSAMLAPEYPVYRIPDFFVGSDPEPIDIELTSLKFVNLSGMILTPESAPVANFEFFITNVSTGVHVRQIVSDSSGFFTLEDFPLGEVSLTTRGAEFYKISGLTLTEDGYANLKLVVDRGDRYLSGWVSDANGLAIAKAMVTLDASFAEAGVEYHSHRSQTTDDGGRFEFMNIARGDHRLSVFAPGFDKLEQQLDLQTQAEQVQLRLTRQPD